jgi:hypothetical protein
MRYLLVCATLLLTSTLLVADEVSHRKAAEEMLKLTDPGENMKIGFRAAAEPTLKQMRQDGFSEEAVREVEETLRAWLKTEMKPEEFYPKIVRVYMEQFTEAELRDLIAFYLTPTGKKFVSTLPTVTQKSMQIAHEYVQSKGASLNARIRAIVQKHKPQAVGE